MPFGQYFGGYEALKNVLLVTLVLVGVLLVIFYVVVLFKESKGMIFPSDCPKLHEGMMSGFTARQVEDILKKNKEGLTANQVQSMLKMGGLVEGLTAAQVMEIANMPHHDRLPEGYLPMPTNCATRNLEGYHYSRSDAGTAEHLDGHDRGNGAMLRSAIKTTIGGDMYTKPGQLGVRVEGMISQPTGSVQPVTYDDIKVVTGRELQKSLYAI